MRALRRKFSAISWVAKGEPRSEPGVEGAACGGDASCGRALAAAIPQRSTKKKRVTAMVEPPKFVS
jgi:hypothetical protein